MLVYVQTRMLRSFKRSQLKKRRQKLKGLNVFGSLKLANYGPEIVVGTRQNSLGPTDKEVTRPPTLATNSFIIEVELVAECLQHWKM